VPKSRKKRLTEQRKLQATLTQTQNRLNKAQADASRYQQQAHSAQQRAAVAMRVPDGLMQDVLARAVRETVRQLVIEMREPVLDIRHRIEVEAGEIERGMLIRGTEPPRMTAVESLENGDTHVTFDFPGFRWTQIIDREMQRSLLSRDGPTFMRDQDIYYVDQPPVPSARVVMDTPDVQSYRNDIPVKVL